MPLNEGLVKWITGGDMVRARNLYLNVLRSGCRPTIYFLPSITSRSFEAPTLGIWSRIRLIPFGVSFLGREDK